jgi:hypothetical protein
LNVIYLTILHENPDLLTKIKKKNKIYYLDKNFIYCFIIMMGIVISSKYGFGKEFVGDGGANFYLCCLLLLADFDKQ